MVTMKQTSRGAGMSADLAGCRSLEMCGLLPVDIEGIEQSSHVKRTLRVVRLAVRLQERKVSYMGTREIEQQVFVVLKSSLIHVFT